MDNISVSKIDLITKAFDQLRLLLERTLAEKELKDQYSRLKNTLTKLKETEELLAQKEKLASVGKFAAGVAHEVNNPLAYVISNISSIDEYVNVIVNLQEMHSQLIKSIDEGNTELCNKLKENINNFQEESDLSFILSDIKSVVADSKEGLDRVKDIVTDLQSFQGGFLGNSNQSDLNEIIKKSITLLKFDMKDIAIEFNEIEGVILVNEVEALYQIVGCILKNSVESLHHTERNEKKIAISIVNTETNLIRINFRDNGAGIPPEIKEKIFDPFFTTKQVGSGKGMGLTVCYNLLNRMGGSILVTSQPEEYTEFSVTIPRLEE